jgi:uncharacterized protein (TIGR03086 family)
VLTVLDESLNWVDGVMAAIGEEHRDAPTPCPEFTVDLLVAHIVDGLVWYGGLPAGGPADPREVHGPDLREVGYHAAFRAARDTVRRNWTPQHLAEVFPMPGGEATGEGVTEYEIVEVLGHGWDLATATGQPVTVAPELAETALRIAQGLDDETLRAPGMMASPVPAGPEAPAIDRFVAYLGRTP